MIATLIALLVLPFRRATLTGLALVALTLARCALDKFGGDSMAETLRNFQGYCQQLKTF